MFDMVIRDYDFPSAKDENRDITIPLLEIDDEIVAQF